MLWRALLGAAIVAGKHWYNNSGTGGGGIVDAWRCNSPPALFPAAAAAAARLRQPHLTKTLNSHCNLASRSFLARTTGDDDTEPLASSSSSSSSPFSVTATQPLDMPPPLAEIMGAGRIGELLASAGACTVLRRGDAIDPTLIGCPVIIATRNDALEGIVAACPPERRADLVFVQNGYLDSFLEKHGLSDNTQALLYLSVPAKGVAPVDGVTRVNPNGLTAATGVHAAALAKRWAAVGMKCHVISSRDYRPAMFEKLMYVHVWYASFENVCMCHDPVLL
jgi:hypothetical protein